MCFIERPVLAKLGFDPRTMPMKPMSVEQRVSEGLNALLDSRSVRETLLHIASMTHFDLHIHEEQRRDSMDGFDFREFFAGLPTYEKSALSKKEILDARESAKSSRTTKG